MSDYYTANKQEKLTGTERRFRGKIIVDHDYDFEIVNHLTTVLGFDVETERIQTNPYNGELHIKVFEMVKREPIKDKKY